MAQSRTTKAQTCSRNMMAAALETKSLFARRQTAQPTAQMTMPTHSCRTGRVASGKRHKSISSTASTDTFHPAGKDFVHQLTMVCKVIGSPVFTYLPTHKPLLTPPTL